MSKRNRIKIRASSTLGEALGIGYGENPGTRVNVCRLRNEMASFAAAEQIRISLKGKMTVFVSSSARLLHPSVVYYCRH